MEELKKSSVTKSKSTIKKITMKQNKAAEGAKEVVKEADPLEPKAVYNRAKKLKDVVLANAVRVGPTVNNYFSEDNHDLTLSGNTIRIRKKSWDRKHPTVYTTLFNTIYYRV